MDRINTSNMATGAGGNLFKDCTAGADDGTPLDANFMNGVMMELINVITKGGQTPLIPFNATNANSYDQLWKAIQAAAMSATPVGTVIAYAGQTQPTGYLEMNGAAVSRVTYSALFAIVGTAFGAGNGTTTFNLPDARGEFIRGWDHGRGIDSGRALGSGQVQQIAAHKHVGALGENTIAAPFGRTLTNNKTGLSGNDTDNYLWHTNDGSDYNGTVNAAGLIGAENRPRNIALMFCIKY